MSKTNDTPTADVQDTTARFEKDVIITFYGSADYNDARRFVADVFDDVDVDLDATTESTEEIVELNVEITNTDNHDRERTVTGTISPFFSADKQALKNAIQSGQLDTDDLDWLEATVEENTEIVHENDPGDALEQFLATYLDAEPAQEFRSLLADHDYVEQDYTMYTGSWTRTEDAVGPDAGPDETEEFNVDVNIRDSYLDRRRVLVHQSERTADNRFVEPDLPEDEQPWSGQIVVSLEAPDDELLDEIAGTLVPDLYAELSTRDGIQAVRLTDCETVTKERGECYSV